MIWINGIELPSPDKGLKIQRQQLVDSGRNAKGQVVAQKINRRLMKVDSLQWKFLKASEWGKILNEIEKFEGTLRIWDAMTGKFVTRKVYWGDAEEEPFSVDENGKITLYASCKCNLIDMGY